ncbi:MAG TPA: hypothetical protein VFM14_19575 [Gemmatimonadales bacterium]|nr:hypothetical protein [Gemmatimonadales bacterium]
MPVLPVTGSAQERCTLQIDNVDRQGIAVETGGGTNYFAGGNVRLSCRGTKIRMRSDSVAAYAGNIVHFVGRVHYEDSSLVMDADRGTYYRASEQWEARGKVKTRNLNTGSTLAGPSLDYFRAVSGVRDTAEMYAVSRPRIEYVTKDSTGQATEPYVIVADRVRIRGDDQLWAGGTVTVDRSDFAARGDSLRLDTGTADDGTLLGQRPELHGVGSDTFDVAGRRIDFKLDDRELTYLVATDSARAVQKEWTLTADTIALDVNRREVELTLAWGDSLRAHAVSPRREIRSDSLALDSPVGVLKEARAFGKAWLGGDTDSASAERDWLAGDTVVARFEPRDSAGASRTVLTRIEASGTARSLTVEPQAARPKQPTINYARGNVILVTMKGDGSEEVDQVRIRGQVDGVQIEPGAADSTPAPRTPAPPEAPPP